MKTLSDTRMSTSAYNRVSSQESLYDRGSSQESLYDRDEIATYGTLDVSDRLGLIPLALASRESGIVSASTNTQLPSSIYHD